MCNSVLFRGDKRSIRRDWWWRELIRREDNLSIIMLLLITNLKPTTERQMIGDTKNNIRHENQNEIKNIYIYMKWNNRTSERDIRQFLYWKMNDIIIVSWASGDNPVHNYLLYFNRGWPCGRYINIIVIITIYYT